LPGLSSHSPAAALVAGKPDDMSDSDNDKNAIGMLLSRLCRGVCSGDDDGSNPSDDGDGEGCGVEVEYRCCITIASEAARFPWPQP
jgi:hypothetical protein